MGREIKFRAWNKKLKQMEPYVTDLNNWHHVSATITVDKYSPRELSRMDDEFELMQFTGLKDKNNKEIYEGDIIKEDFTGTSIISWDVGNLQYRMTEPVSNAKNGFLSMGMELEVIGNIYENPELIQKPEVLK